MLVAALFSLAAGPQPEGLMKCSITHSSNGTGTEIMSIHMQSVTPTLPYK